MNIKKILTAMTFLAVTSGVNAAPIMVTFDNNGGGTAAGEVDKTGTEQTATSYAGLRNGEPFGDALGFSGFSVTAGISKNFNLASNATFNINSKINLNSRRAYQDLSPAHGGLGAVPLNNFSDDNLNPNVGRGYNLDEILFFDFDIATILETVFFNGPHNPLTDISGNNNDQLFNIFYSSDGILYNSVLSNGRQKRPVGGEYLSTGLKDAFQYYAVTSSGLGQSPGGYVEAIEFTSVPEPRTIGLILLGLVGLTAIDLKKKNTKFK